MFIAIAPFACDYLQFSKTLQTCIAVWAKRRIPFKVYLISVLRLKGIQEKNRFDYLFFFFPVKSSAAYVGGDKCV